MSSASSDISNQLERLAKLRADGILSEEEFTQLKAAPIVKQAADSGTAPVCSDNAALCEKLQRMNVNQLYRFAAELGVAGLENTQRWKRRDLRAHLEREIARRLGLRISSTSNSADPMRANPISSAIQLVIGIVACVIGLFVLIGLKESSTDKTLSIDNTRSTERVSSVPAPSGFADLKWESAPSKNLQEVMPTSGVYTPRKPLRELGISFRGAKPAELDYLFEDRKLFGGDMYFDGPDKFALLKTLVVRQYGAPSSEDNSVPSAEWKWDNDGVSISLHYQPKFARTTLNFTEDLVVAHESDRIAAVSTDVRTIKTYLRDPASADWVGVQSNYDGSIVCVVLRARNGFGGMTVANYSVANNKIYQTTSAWNRYCVKKDYVDVSNEARSAAAN